MELKYCSKTSMIFLTKSNMRGWLEAHLAVSTTKKPSPPFFSLKILDYNSISLPMYNHIPEPVLLAQTSKSLSRALIL